MSHFRVVVLAAWAMALMTGPARGEDQQLRILIITGDHLAASHDWKATTKALEAILPGRVESTAVASRDLTPENLDRYDVLLLNYRDTPTGSAESRWSEANKKAFLDAVRGGKGLVILHNAGAAFNKPNWTEFERAIGGGWRAQGNHGPRHAFEVKTTDVKHPISEGLPARFTHAVDELYQNSLMVPGNVVLATAYSDPSKPKGTGKDEPVIWINQYGSGRVFHMTLGHDAQAISDSHLQEWLKRGVAWTGEKRKTR